MLNCLDQTHGIYEFHGFSYKFFYAANYLHPTHILSKVPMRAIILAKYI